MGYNFYYSVNSIATNSLLCREDENIPNFVENYGELKMTKATKDFTRGEKQKEVNDNYRDNWDRIFNKEEDKKS